MTLDHTQERPSPVSPPTAPPTPHEIARAALLEALKDIPFTEAAPRGYREYELVGLRWTFSPHVSWIYHQRGNIELQLYPKSGETLIMWQWCHALAPAIYLRKWGKAATIEAAAEAVSQFQPPTLDYEYLGKPVTWYELQTRYWNAAVDGDEATIFEYKAASDQPLIYIWSRCCRAVAPLELVKEKKLAGECPTLEEAFRAVVDAPEAFKRACGAWLARLVMAIAVVFLGAALSACSPDAAPADGGAAPQCLMKTDAGEVPRTCFITACCSPCGPGWVEGTDPQHTCVYEPDGGAW